MLSSFWRRFSKVGHWNEGAPIKVEKYSKLPFNNNMSHLTLMFQLRFWLLNNTPFNWDKHRYANDLSHLHNQLNYQQSRLILRRVLLVFGIITLYGTFVMEEYARDWKDGFDLKFMNKTYGTLDDASGEGATSIDDE